MNAPMSVADIAILVGQTLEISGDAILGPCRRRSVAWARFVVVALARKHTGLSYQRIGHAIGGRDHTTITHAIRRCDELRAKDRDFHDMFAQCEIAVGRAIAVRRAVTIGTTPPMVALHPVNFTWYG